MRRSAILVCVFVMGIALQARADSVTYRFEGVISNEWADPNWLLDDEFLDDITQGAHFSMTLTWDTDTPVQNVTAPDTTTYFPAYTSLSGIIDNRPFGLAPGIPFGHLTVGNGSDGIFDRLSGTIIDQFTGPTWGDADLTITSWSLVFPSETWSTSAIPSVLPSAPRGGGALLYFNAGDYRRGKVGAVLTSIHQVPEPSALVLVGVGLLATARKVRRRR